MDSNRFSAKKFNFQQLGVNFCSINICGMSKRSQLCLNKFCYDKSIDILAVQESSSVDSTNYDLLNMSFVSDSNGSANKGAMLYVNNRNFTVTDYNEA